MNKPTFSPTPSVKKSSLVATVAIIGSRLFGLIREQVFAYFFGAGWVQDAYYAAFRIPNLFRDLLAEGGLSQAFVTVFVQKSDQDENQARILANKIFSFLLIVVGCITVLGVIFSPQIVAFIAKGFTDEKYALAVQLNRILFPILLCASLGALCMGLLNAKHKFFLPQSASTFFNITSILVGLTLAYVVAPDYMGALFNKLLQGSDVPYDKTGSERAIIGMALGTLAGGLVQWLCQMPLLAKLGFRPRLDFAFRDPELLRIFKLAIPAIIGGAAVQINIIVNTQFASEMGTGAISFLSYAFRLMQFPLGVFGVAIATASAPTLAKMVGDKRLDEFKTTMQSSLQMSLFLCLPSAIGLIILAEPIISLIYEHGHFNALDTVETAFALMSYAPGLIGYSMIKIYQPAYLAWHDAKTPMRVALLSIALNFLMNWFFTHVLHLPHWSLALGTALMATLNFLFLAFLFRNKVTGIWNQQQTLHLIKILLASLVMGAATLGTLFTIDHWIMRYSITFQLIRVFVPISVALMVYFGLTIALHVNDANLIFQSLKKKLSRN